MNESEAKIKLKIDTKEALDSLKEVSDASETVYHLLDAVIEKTNQLKSLCKEIPAEMSDQSDSSSMASPQ